MKEPSITDLKLKERIFHDSFLIKVSFNHDLSILEVVLECNFYKHKFWKLIISGILRFEFESLGAGVTLVEPVDIYEVSLLDSSEEKTRWDKRLKELEINSTVYHLVLCSSHLRGLLNDKKEMEGIQIICRNIEIEKVL
ncbi:MAG TPA: hypothetical protein ENJ95_11245 [Bacteroidetes bacterium]|nr:hypothetical protein [Bacteroidota bacterium]